MRKVKNDAGIRPGEGLGHRGQLEFRELIIPHFLLIDVISLTQLDGDEAEFIGNLLYGTDY